MARFRLTQSLDLSNRRIAAGRTICDSQGAALPGDEIWTGLNAGSMIPGMVPLDGSATTMKAASIYSSEPTPTQITGVNSIQP